MTETLARANLSHSPGNEFGPRLAAVGLCSSLKQGSVHVCLHPQTAAYRDPDAVFHHHDGVLPGIRVAPGGPFNQERGLSPEIKANLERQFGLDDPLWLQYLNYLKNVLRGDFGPSYVSPNFTVTEKFANGLPVSVQLGLSALVLALLVGGTLGIIAALNQNKGADYAVIATATAGSTIPTFVIALSFNCSSASPGSCCQSAAGGMAR